MKGMHKRKQINKLVIRSMLGKEPRENRVELTRVTVLGGDPRNPSVIFPDTVSKRIEHLSTAAVLIVIKIHHLAVHVLAEHAQKDD